MASSPTSLPPPVINGATQTLHLAVAEELRQVRVQLEELASILVSDVHFIEQYLNQLQNFDFLAQAVEESAAILDRLAAGASADTAIAPVRLGLVHERLQAALSRTN